MTQTTMAESSSALESAAAPPPKMMAMAFVAVEVAPGGVSCVESDVDGLLPGRGFASCLYPAAVLPPASVRHGHADAVTSDRLRGRVLPVQWARVLLKVAFGILYW